MTVRPTFVYMLSDLKKVNKAGDGAKIEKMEIQNQYKGKSPEQVWNAWSFEQRRHFLYDHQKNWSGKTVYGVKEVNASLVDGVGFNELPQAVKDQLEMHLEDGQYGKGGPIPENKYYYLKPKALFKDSGGVAFEITGHTPTSLKARRFSEVEKNTPEIEIPYSEVLDLVADKKMVFFLHPIDKMREFALLEMEIENIKLNFHHKDSIKTYQSELEQAADKIDKLNAELSQVKKEANTLMDDLGKKSAGYNDSMAAMEAIATKNKFIKADDAFDILKAKGAKKLRTSSDGINYISTSGPSRLLFRKEELGHRYVDKKELEDAIKNIGNIKAPTNRDVPKEIDDVITRKPSDWDGIDKIDSRLVQKYISFFKALPEYKIKAANPMDDLDINYIEPFIGKLGRNIYLIVPEGYKYARYAGDITDAWTPVGKEGKWNKAGKGTQVSPCTDCDTKLKSFLKEFPSNTKTWAKATDEMRDLARELREYYNEQNDLSEGQKGYIDGLPFREFKTPSEWNTKAKKQILSTWKKLSKEQKESFASNNSFLNPDND